MKPSPASLRLAAVLCGLLLPVFNADIAAAKHATTKIPPADFTVGSRLVTGSLLKEAFVGRMAGLAVFNRALSDAEMMSLHTAADVAKLNQP